jgi:RNA polymerase sigma factor (sigma-70 family)
MSTARIIPHHQGDEHGVAYDSAQFISDEGLVAVAKMGDGTVFDELHKRHAERMFRVAHRIIRHREDAEDAVQESFLSAYVHLKTFGGRARFSTWLTRIAMNVALMKVRKHRVSREVPFKNTRDPLELWPEPILVDSSLGPEAICAKGERDAALRDAITKLRPNLRKVVELYQLQECSLHETAKVLGISVAAAKGRLFHARNALRRNKALLPHHGGPRRDSHKNSFSRTSCAVPFAP